MNEKPTEIERAAERFDLHMHSVCSDGADEPRVLVQRATEAGVRLLALTDHDCVLGVQEAVAAGKEAGARVLPAVEMDTEWPGEMHILGLDVDVTESHFTGMLEIARERRIARNKVIFERLAQAGYDVLPHLGRPIGTVTRLHIALALIDAGYAENIRQAFDRYLRRGCPGYFAMPRFSPQEVVGGILGAGGVPVWAHPFHSGNNVHKMLDMLCAAGLMGIEAYHPSCTEGESEVLVSLARQKSLLVTCGSDSHGANRPGVVPGCTWRDTPELNHTFAFFMGRPPR